MDILDFVPFLGFIRNDEETISIMAEASVVIPQVCDILGISLSDSESDGEEEHGRRRRSLRSSTPSSSASLSSSGFSNVVVEEEDEEEEGEEEEVDEEDDSSIPDDGPRYRRRRESSTSSLLKALITSSAHSRNDAKDDLSSLMPRKRVNSQGSDDVDPDNPNGQSAAHTAAYTSDLVLPPRKRRVSTRSSESLSNSSHNNGPDPTSSTNSSSRTSSSAYSSLSTSPSIAPVSPDDPIRQQLRQDVDSFNDKIRQLAALEREKNQLLETLLSISTTITQETGSDGGLEEEEDHDLQISSQQVTATNQAEHDELMEEEEEEDDDDLLLDDDLDSEISSDEEEEEDEEDDIATEIEQPELPHGIEVDEGGDGELIYEVGEEEEIETTEVVEEQIVTLDSYELLQSP